MFLKLKKWFLTSYRKAINSIAFYPVFISASLAVFSFLIYTYRQNALDEWIKQVIPFLQEADAESLRSLMTTVAAGSISISVFSFSMVMVVLSQASQTYSPKILDGITKNKRPQRILGFYIGTVVFCLPQLLLISEQYERSISPFAVLFALGLAVLNMFFFIEFIDFISNSIKPNQICRGIYKRTLKRLDYETKERDLENDAAYVYDKIDDEKNWTEEVAFSSGYFQGLDHQDLYNVCKKARIKVRVAHQIGVQVLKNQCLFYYQAEGELEEETKEKLHSCFHFYDVEDIEKNAFYGFRELAEIGAKAMSPGVNDIGTARISLDLLIDLIADFAKRSTKFGIKDEGGNTRIYFNPTTLPDVFEKCLDEIRIYATNDKSIMLALLSGCRALLLSNQGDKLLEEQTQHFLEKVLENIKNSESLKQDRSFLLDYYKTEVAAI